VHMESRTFGEPVPKSAPFVGAVVIHDDVDLESPRHVRLDQIEEFPKLAPTVALMELRDSLRWSSH